MDKLGKRFLGNSQQDAHEFLSDFIDFLADEYEQKQQHTKENVEGENGVEMTYQSCTSLRASLYASPPTIFALLLY